MKAKAFVDLYTPEGEALSGQPWNVYPRPQMRRESFLNLNGEWEFALAKLPEQPHTFPHKILVPFAPQSLLSGLRLDCPEDGWLYYRTAFSARELEKKGRVLLHFGAVDQIADVWLNGTFLGRHVGGYEHFTFDITGALEPENTLVVRVEDHMSSCKLPYGKQTKARGGMWYTPVAGIWQTVWVESVPSSYIRAVHYRTGSDWAELEMEGDGLNGVWKVTTPEGVVETAVVDGHAWVELSKPRLWTPKEPYLYRCVIETGEDRVESYFALRTLSIEKMDGISRLCLNGKPYFFHGILDQGYWSDGLFTPAAPVCYEKDILAMKALGFNMLRKHIKVEADQFYYDCDRLGMVVFQDMVNNGRYHYVRDTVLPTVGLKKRDDRKLHRDPETRACFLQGMERTVTQLKDHPCICCWTIFNEGWGQFEGTKTYTRLKELDDSRFIDTMSGWFFGGESDVVSEHIYFRPFKAYPTEKPLVLSEFGGYSLTLKDHCFNPYKEYGYKHFDDQQAYERALTELYDRDVAVNVPLGLCASVYTQVSDVEDETNGLLTYDRRVTKVSPEIMLAIAEKLKITTEEL